RSQLADFKSPTRILSGTNQSRCQQHDTHAAWRNAVAEVMVPSKSLRRERPRLAPGPSGSASPEDGGTARIPVEVADHRVRLARIGGLGGEGVAALLRGGRPGRAG